MLSWIQYCTYMHRYDYNVPRTISHKCYVHYFENIGNTYTQFLIIQRMLGNTYNMYIDSYNKYKSMYNSLSMATYYIGPNHVHISFLTICFYFCFPATTISNICPQKSRIWSIWESLLSETMKWLKSLKKLQLWQIWENFIFKETG